MVIYKEDIKEEYQKNRGDMTLFYMISSKNNEELEKFLNELRKRVKAYKYTTPSKKEKVYRLYVDDKKEISRYNSFLMNINNANDLREKLNKAETLIKKRREELASSPNPLKTKQEIDFLLALYNDFQNDLKVFQSRIHRAIVQTPEYRIGHKIETDYSIYVGMSEKGGKRDLKTKWEKLTTPQRERLEKEFNLFFQSYMKKN